MPALLMDDRTRRQPQIESVYGLLRREDHRARAPRRRPCQDVYFVYRNGGAPEWLKLGMYPAVGLAEARDLVQDHRHGLDIEDVDPAVERRKPKPDPAPAAPAFTFADFVPVYVKFQKGQHEGLAGTRSRTTTRHLLQSGSARAQEHHAHARARGPRPASPPRT